MLPILDQVWKVLGVLGAILGAILSAKVFGPEARKARSESRKADAERDRVVSDTAILWIDRWEEELELWQGYAYTLEASIEEWTAAWAELKRAIEASGADIVLPKTPPSHRRPRRKRPDDKP